MGIFFSRAKTFHRSRGQRPPATRRLFLESLEDRLCLSSYSIIDIGTLGGTYSNATGMNGSGQVVGLSYTAVGDQNAQHAFLWQNGTMTDLGTLGGSLSSAGDINTSGQIVGSSHTTAGSSASHAFLWTPTSANGTSGSMTDLGTLGGVSSLAGAINDQGQIVGYSKNAGGDLRTFVWENSVMYDLDALLPANSGWVTQALYGIDINDNKQIAGTGLFNGVQRAFLISDNDASFANGGLTITNLGTLAAGSSWAGSVNKLGQVVGSSNTKDGSSHAFRYSGGVMTDLKTLGGNPTTQPTSNANAINNTGHVVGRSGTASYGVDHAFLWQNGKMTDLNKVLPRGSAWVLESANDINGTGQVVGQGSIGGQRHAFLLVPGVSALQSSSVHTASGTAVMTLSVSNSSTQANSTSNKTAAVQNQSTAATSPPHLMPDVVDLVLNTVPMDRQGPSLHVSLVTVYDDVLADFFAED